jgi:nitric oxide reductase subunit B
VFLFGGVLPLVWFILSRGRSLLPEREMAENEWSDYQQEWAAHEEDIVRVIQPGE